MHRRTIKDSISRENQQYISIIQLDTILDIVWKNKAGFDMLNYSVRSLRGGYSVSNLITLVENELSMDK